MLLQRKRFWAQIDLDCARYNYQKIRQALKPTTALCCVVKANAYGHGAVGMSRLYQELGADWFAVSNIEEAMQLRQNGIVKPILILGYTSPECAGMLGALGLSQAVFSEEYGKALAARAEEAGVAVKIHIKLDSGMGRLGFSCKHGEEDLPQLEAAAELCRGEYLIPEGVFTHFAVSDGGAAGQAYTRAQYRSFCRAVDYFADNGVSFSVRHCANSAAILDFPEYQMDMVRAGIVLYGLSPSQEMQASPELLPVMSLHAVISLVKEIEPGDAVSYGCVFRADRKTRIATVPVGYADGYLRSNSEAGMYMLVHGKPAPIVGRICMDQLMLDVTHIPDVRAGDAVTVIGADGDCRITAEDIAGRNGTIPYEILCAVGERVPRFYLQGGRIAFVKDSIVEAGGIPGDAFAQEIFRPGN